MIAKLVISLAFLASVVSALEISEATKAIIEVCRKPYNIEVEQIRTAVRNRQLPETEDGKCFLQCVMEKGGIVKDGKIDANRAKELSAQKLADKPDMKPKVDQIIDTCAKEVQQPEGKCEFGLEIMKCTIKQREAMGLPPPEIEGI